MRNRFRNLTAVESIHGLFHDIVFYNEIPFLFFFFVPEKFSTENFEMFKNNCLRRSRSFPIRKRRGRFWGIFTCTKVRKNTYMVRKNTYEYSTFFHLSTFLHHLLQERWAKIRIFIVWLSAYVIISSGVITKVISEGNIYYQVYWYPAVTLLSRILISCQPAIITKLIFIVSDPYVITKGDIFLPIHYHVCW